MRSQSSAGGKPADGTLCRLSAAHVHGQRLVGSSHGRLAGPAKAALLACCQLCAHPRTGALSPSSHVLDRVCSFGFPVSAQLRLAVHHMHLLLLLASRCFTTWAHASCCFMASLSRAALPTLPARWQNGLSGTGLCTQGVDVAHAISELEVLAGASVSTCHGPVHGCVA